MRLLNLFILFGILLVGCTRSGEDKIPVTVEKVWAEQKMANIQTAAVLEPSEKIQIQFPIPVKIDQVAVKLGSTVAQGDPLFALNEEEFTLQLAPLKTKLMEQEALSEKNIYFLKNRDRLLEEGKIDQSMFDTLEAEVKALEAKAASIKNDLAMIEHHVRSALIVAPFNGIVSEKNVSPGGTLAAGQTAMTLLSITPIRAVFRVSAKDAPLLEKGIPVIVTLKGVGGKKRDAVLSFISPEIEAGGNTVVIHAELANENQSLKGGQEATVELVSPRKINSLSIPASSVLTDGDKEFVYIVRENKAWRVRIFTRKNPENPGVAEVLEGLKETDIVVTQGHEKLTQGAEVNLWR